jgi:uncharacterized surface protein with fasciclin (FAS1) repeats
MMKIIETASADDSFKTLIVAVNAASLTEMLSESGPFTLFAPNEAAFAKLPQGTLEGLLQDVPKLQQLLSYHVVVGKLLFADVMKLPTAITMQGQKVGIASNNGVVKLNNAKVIQTDILCENGVIHVLDSVLTLPTAKFATT